MMEKHEEERAKGASQYRHRTSMCNHIHTHYSSTKKGEEGSWIQLPFASGGRDHRVTGSSFEIPPHC